MTGDGPLEPVAVLFDGRYHVQGVRRGYRDYARCGAVLLWGRGPREPQTVPEQSRCKGCWSS